MDEIGFSRQARGTPFWCITPKECTGKDVEALQPNDAESTFTMLATIALDDTSIPRSLFSHAKPFLVSVWNKICGGDGTDLLSTARQVSQTAS